MTGSTPSIDVWASVIRSTIANGPGLQFFEDEIQSQGFLFLDEYLDNIISKSTKDPLIELVKTPGRRKDAHKNVRVVKDSAKKVKKTKPKADEVDKENAAPVNSFEHTLLKAKGDDASLHLSKQSQRSNQNKPPLSNHSPAPFMVNEISQVAPRNGEQERSTIPTSFEESTMRQLDEYAPPEVHDLSNIPEANESHQQQGEQAPLRARTSAVSPPPRPSSRRSSQRMSSVEEFYDIDDTRHTRSSSGQTYHTVPLSSPDGTPAPAKTSLLGHHCNHTAPLPSQSLNIHSKANIDCAMTAPLPVVEVSSELPKYSTAVPIRDHETSPKLTHKKSLSAFPSLPVPSPARKSLKPIREPSIGYGPPPSTSNVALGGTLGSKRTSWLQKAREVKALDTVVATTSRPSNAPPTVHVTRVTAASLTSTHGGVKRKSGDMFITGAPLAYTPEAREDARKSKLAKLHDGDVGSAFARNNEYATPFTSAERLDDAPKAEKAERVTMGDNVATGRDEENLFSDVKRTTESMGARMGRSMGRSLGGAAALKELAEAKAAAEARIAERNGVSAEDEQIAQQGRTIEPSTVQAPGRQSSGTQGSIEAKNDRRLSVADLVSSYEGHGSAEVTRGTTDAEPSTTPRHSPPPGSRPSFALPSGPVFTKAPVFLAPVRPATPEVSEHPKSSTFRLPAAPASSLPPAMSLSVPAQLPSPPASLRPPMQHMPAPLSAQSTAASVGSDAVFDQTDDVAAWMPTTQDTEYSFSDATQTRQYVDDIDEIDDVTDPLRVANTNATTTTRNESMTWTTIAGGSQRADTAPLRSHIPISSSPQRPPTVPGAFVGTDDDLSPSDAEIDVIMSESELLDLEVETGKVSPPVSTVDDIASSQRSHNQLSTSTAPSTHQMGFFGQASKLVSSLVGGGKKAKPAVASLQRAAAAAKKEQDEKDKKAVRLKEMEHRRQLALQRKAEDEKARSIEQEKRIKEEAERRRREREELTDKRPLKVTVKKADDDNTRKRKLAADADKRLDTKKPALSKDQRDNTTSSSRLAQPSTGYLKTTKPPLPPQPTTSAFGSHNSAQASSSAAPTKVIPGTADNKPFRPTSSLAKPKEKAVSHQLSDDAQPSTMLQYQMAARAKVQIQAAKAQPTITSESIELPDINSEYSDSDDEDRPRTFDPPDWAQSPELRKALEDQSKINPDILFGAIRPLRMEELFRTQRQNKFRARTSSANWTGVDKLTIEEEKEYARRMGFQ